MNVLKSAKQTYKQKKYLLFVKIMNMNDRQFLLMPFTPLSGHPGEVQIYLFLYLRVDWKLSSEQYISTYEQKCYNICRLTNILQRELEFLRFIKDTYIIYMQTV